MKAHKVPATYLSGWEIPTLKDRVYVFYKSQIAQLELLSDLGV